MIEGIGQKVAVTVEIGRKFRSTRSTTGRSPWRARSPTCSRRETRKPPPPGLSDTAVAALKTFRLGDRVCLSGRLGEIAGSGLFDISCAVRQERGRSPSVPADAALRGAHRGAGAARNSKSKKQQRRIEGPSRCRLSLTIFPYGSKKLPIFAANVVATSQPLAAHGRPAHAGQGRQRGRCRDRQPRSPSPWSSRP